MLCRWHIQQNIAKYHKQRFSDEDWDIFIKSWNRLLKSPDVRFYHYNLSRLHERLCKDNREGILSIFINYFTVVVDED